MIQITPPRSSFGGNATLIRPLSAMMYCREYLHRFLMLTQRDDFQPWHWCWPGQHQPLHSIMVLIQDLEECPSGPLARQTRRLVDLALTMTGQAEDNGGIMSQENGDPDFRPLQDGGHEAWKFVRMARDKCWERAGLDPDVFTCPLDANEIYFGEPPTPSNNASDDTLVTSAQQDFAAGMFDMAVEENDPMGFLPGQGWDFGSVPTMRSDQAL